MGKKYGAVAAAIAYRVRSNECTLKLYKVQNAEKNFRKVDALSLGLGSGMLTANGMVENATRVEPLLKLCEVQVYVGDTAWESA